MNEQIFNLILLLIPVLGGLLTGFILPSIRARLSAVQMDEIAKWVARAVQAAEVLFDMPQSGDEKREYVIQFIDKTFNSKKKVISRQQIQILLESAWKEMTDT